MIHEAGHAMLAFPDYCTNPSDPCPWLEKDTVMKGEDPAVGTTGSQHFSYQRCDEAGAQLDWDLGSKAGEYADCFDHISHHGTDGLVTDLTLGQSTTLTGCVGVPYPVSGRLQVHDYSSYNGMGGNPLIDRTVKIDRGGAAYTSTVAAGGTTGNNWTKSLSAPSSPVTYSYDAHFDNPSGDGLDSSTHRPFTIQWTNSPQVCA